jgi:predicted lipoprotein with Yx(FWY)xxD motif
VRRMASLVVLLVTGAVMLAACGGDDSSVTSGSSKRNTGSSTTTSTVAPKPTVQIAESALGPILVDEDGFTLYLLDTDTATTISCTGECATTWPPLTVTSAPVAGPGVDSSLLSTLGTSARKHVTYAGHPLYRFSGDQAAGQTNGFGVGGIWWVLAADGTKITPPPPPPPETQPRVVAPPTSPPAEQPPAPAPPPPPPPPPSSPSPSYGY